MVFCFGALGYLLTYILTLLPAIFGHPWFRFLVLLPGNKTTWTCDKKAIIVLTIRMYEVADSTFF